MRNFTLMLTAVFGIALAGGPSLAAPVTFDFTGLGTGQSGQLNLTSGGVSLRVTAVNRSVNTGNPPPNQFQDINVTFNGNGLGARVNGADSADFDSMGPDEALRFRIMGLPSGVAALRLDEAVFFGLNISDPPPASQEEFTLTIDNDTIIHPDIRPSATTPWFLATDIPDPALRTGLLNFRFQLESAVPFDNDSFRISSLTFETIAAEVSAPGGAGMLCVALAVLARMRLR